MPSKSAKSWLARFPRTALVASACLAAVPASATVTVKPVEPYAVASGKLWYGTGNYVFDTEQGFFRFSLLATALTEPTSTIYSNSGMYFDISSDKSFSPSSTEEVVVSVLLRKDGEGSEDPLEAPIGRVGGSSPSTCGASCQVTTDEDGRTYYYAARFTGKDPKNVLRVGLFPKDLCKGVFARHNAVGDGCKTGGEIVEPTPSPSASPTEMRFKFRINKAATNALPADDSGDDTSEEITVSLHADQPTNASDCTTAQLADAYFPGDGEIELNVSPIGSSTQASFVPVNTVLVIGSENASGGTSTLIVDSSYASNPIRSRIALGGAGAVGGFDNNSTNGYSVAFAQRDASGALSAFRCQISNVRTSEVQGFLKSSNCFIATASYGSKDVWPVRTLRAFRDEVLLQVGPGRAFTEWYYSWSPRGALWLNANPEFKPIVLSVLAPIVAFSYLVLHPVGFVALWLGLGAVAWWSGHHARRRTA